VTDRSSAGVGRLITLEGPEGGGKTTQARRLADLLRDRGHDVILTREPGGTVVGERIRKLLLDEGLAARLEPLTDALLFNAARSQLITELIRPSLSRGAIVVATRFADSTLAYQGFGAGVPLPDLRTLERIATGGLRPDLTIILDLPVAAGLARKAEAEWTRFESGFDVAFHERVRDGFLALADAEAGRFVVVDAMADPDDVAGAIARSVSRLPGLGSVATPVSLSDTAGEPPAVHERIHR
jgi:dTMP kinase